MAEPFATSVASNLVSKLGEYLFAPIGRQFGYVLCYKSYVQDLENGVEKLETARERVQSSVDEAVYNAKHIHTDVKNWLESVENKAKEARDLLNHGGSAQNACFHGWLPNPMMRHRIGRKVKKITQVIQGLHDESANSKFQKVYHENPPIGIVTATTSAGRAVDDKDVMESRAQKIEDVMKAITDDKCCAIGVYGPGGVGKSKLLEDIEKRVKKKKLVDVIAVANVSRNPDVKTIQGEIADALGLKLMNVESIRGRANSLRERLECDSNSEKNILIILDNLWKKLELKDVGIPCDDDNKVNGCKVLLSSRHRDVLRSDMCIDREFRLNELNPGEAQRLFERTVEDKANDPEFKPFVDGIVKKCGGLPLLILSVAKRLKYGALAEWRNASTNMDLSDAKSIVELNYNDLEDDRIRSVFLISALDSGRIFLNRTLSYCMGLGLYKKFKTIEDARDRLIMDIHKLQDSSLLLDGDGMEGFRMHDIFVDMAISIASAQWHALAGRVDYGFKDWSKDDLRKCTVMSFLFVGIDELPEKLECPNLRMLLLLENNPSLKVPESFFESTGKLNVLGCSDLSFNSLPSSIECLENLNTLYLDYCHLGDVTALGKLKGLQFLSLHKAVITKLSKEIGELTELRYLDLTSCTELKIIEPGVLGSLVNLEELYMEDSFDRWDAEDEAPQSNASLAELKNMKKLRTLYIAIPYSSYLPRDLPFGKLSKYKIQIGDVWDWSGEYIGSKTLKLKVDSKDYLLKESLAKCLQNAQDLHLDGLQDGIDSIHNLCVKGFQELKHIHVQNSSSFKYVVRSIENVPCTTFTKLESLFLKNLSNLEKISRGCLALESFSKLKIVKVDRCGEIKHLFHLSMKRIISQLEEIEISRCHFIQEVLIDAEADEDGNEINDENKVKSCNLRKLTLQNLPEMTSFCKTVDHSVNFFDGHQVSLPWLESLTLSKLPKMKEIWNKNPRRASCFQDLSILKVQNCDNLRFLFSSSLAKALGQIKEIEIASCKLMEDIIDVEGEELEEAALIDTLEFPLLTSLSLKELPKLKTFFCGSIHCPTLKRLVIYGCPKMMTFSSFKGKQKWMTADAGLQQAFGHVSSSLSLPAFFDQNVEFPNMEWMKISHMDNMEKIWPSELASNAFTKLETLVVEYCEKLSSLFSSHAILTRFQNLKEIVMTNCESLEVVFNSEEFNFGDACSTSTSELRKLVLSHLPKMKHVWSGPPCGTLTFERLQLLEARNCESLKSLFPVTIAKSMIQLEGLLIRDCGVEEIIMDEDGAEMRVDDMFFPRLTNLRLLELPKWRSFYRNIHTSTWPLLKQLRVRHCGKMWPFSYACDFQSCQGTTTNENQPAFFSFEEVIPRLEGVLLTWEDVEVATTQQHSIFGSLRHLCLSCYHDENVAFPSNFLLHSFPKLEHLHVYCSSFEEIFPEDASGLGGATPCGGLIDMENPLQAPTSLKNLELWKLCNLRRVWKDGSLMAEILNQIEYLFVSQCPSLSIVFPSPTSFQRLMLLRVENCAGLVHMGTCSAVTSLVHLTRLILRNCGAMEDVVKDDGNGVEKISFTVLEELILEGLPSLESFSPTYCSFRFPALVRIVVTQCPKMNKFCKGALRTPNLDKVLLSDGDDEWRWEGDLDTTIRTLST